MSSHESSGREPPVVVIGAGPTGLSAAYHLGSDALLIEGREEVGGWCRSITDGGGRYTALREPLAGKSAVVRFHLETARRRTPISRSEIRWVNGVAALIVETRPLRPQMAPRLVLRCELDEQGLIRELHTILAPDKLTAVQFASAADGPSPDV